MCARERAEPRVRKYTGSLDPRSARKISGTGPGPHDSLELIWRKIQEEKEGVSFSLATLQGENSSDSCWNKALGVLRCKN